MIQRPSATITIMRGNDTVTTVAITPSCRRKFHLMSEDSVSLSFSLAEAVPILPGDYIDDVLFGRFYAKEQQMPTYNPRTCGFDYSLVFVKWYWLWDAHMLMYCDVAYENAENSVPVLGVANDHRKEASWVLTETLEYHVKAALTNVKLLGMLPKKNTIAYKTLNYDLSTCERRGEVRFLSYDHVGIIQGLSMMAEEYGCEWWVTENDEYVTVHFGKCESGDAMEFTLNDNVETMSTQRNQNSYANRVYALGSTKNLPISYRKTLGPFKATDFDYVNMSQEYDPNKGYWDEISQSFIYPDLAVDDREFFYHRFKAENCEFHAWMFKDFAAEISYRSGPFVLSPIKKFRVALDTKDYFVIMRSGFEPSVGGEVNNITPLTVGIDTDVDYPNDFVTGTEFYINFYDPTDDAQDSPNPLMGLITAQIPDAWWLGTDDDPSSLFSFGERRLMLPIADAPDGYLQTDEALNEFQRIEEVVKFEGVYPRCYLEVTKVTAKEKDDKGEELPDGSRKPWSWKQYTIEARNYLDGSEFPFTASFVKNDELAAVFLSEMDAENAYGSGWQKSGNYLLAGMTFKVEFHEYDTTENNATVHVREYKLLPNEDYGAKLPNETLCPSVGDVFVLTGWDVKNMESLGMVAQAEQDLKYYTQEYLDAIEEGNFLFQCNMRSDWPFTLATTGHPYNLPTEGQRVAIYHDALKENADADGQRVKLSRVIGYEFKLDIPYDSPMYEVGETDAFSRLKRLEKAMSGDTSAYPIRVRERDFSGDVIVFDDQAVKALCVSNWGGNVVEGEITKGEAATVTSLNGVFRGQDITTFDELRFFTGLESLYYNYANSAYNGQLSFCSNLIKITLPAAPISNWGGFVRQTPSSSSTALLTLDMTPITAEEITLNAPWRECYRLESLKIPGRTYKGTMRYGFRNCTQLVTIEIDGIADFSGITEFTSCFASCTKLEVIKGAITGIKYDISLANSSKLTRESLLIIINGLAQVTTQKTLTLHATAKERLTEDDIAIATAKNWQIP